MVLISLPLEIPHIVLSDLRPRDVANARLTCRVLAELGLRHLVPRVSLVRLPQAFERLQAIANHPVLSQHVVHLKYYVDGVPPIEQQSHLDLALHDQQSHLDLTIRDQYSKLYDAFISHEEKEDEASVLINAFSKLPKLTSISVTSLYDEHKTINHQAPLGSRFFQSRWPGTEFVAEKVILLRLNATASTNAEESISDV